MVRFGDYFCFALKHVGSLRVTIMKNYVMNDRTSAGKRLLAADGYRLNYELQMRKRSGNYCD